MKIGTRHFWAYLGQGLGCLLLLIGIAVVIWALQGFPGLS